jgi:threonine/homoserine/homoserine lactone efflux protein
METGTVFFFAVTVLPLICTPGPDMFFVTSQALSAGTAAGFRATAGVCLGYTVHSVLVAIGVAALVAASPLLFAALRWMGVGYLVYLACMLIRSAMRSGSPGDSTGPTGRQLERGFVTALLNPKGTMIYFAILPQFMNNHIDPGFQAFFLSAIFISLLAAVYAALTIIVTAPGTRKPLGDRRRRSIEAIAGGLLLVAAGRLAIG